jgi:hypothetical protein
LIFAMRKIEKRVPEKEQPRLPGGEVIYRR